MKPRRTEGGYTLLMVVFMVATILILATAVAPNLLTQGRRDREEEMVWRGEQYERAIGLYYRALGRYPTKVDDLTRQTNGVRFLRKAYTDPMNKDDGTWRFIYVGPNGQLIGSVRQVSLLQSILSTPTTPGMALPGASTQTGSNGGLLGLGSGMGAASGSMPGTMPGTAGQPGQSTNSAATPNPLQSQPQPLQGAVIGGNIIGVGSKMKQPSLRVYEGGESYAEWEFIWNPTQQVAIPGQQPPAGPAAPTQPQTPQTPQGATNPQMPQMPQNPGMPPM